MSENLAKYEFEDFDIEASKQRLKDFMKNKIPTIEGMQRSIQCTLNHWKNEDLKDFCISYEFEYHTQHIFKQLAEHYIWRMSQEKMTYAEVMEKYIQDYNYLGQRFKELRNELNQANALEICKK